MDGIFRDNDIKKTEVYSLNREFPLNKLKGKVLEKIEVEDKKWAINIDVGKKNGQINKIVFEGYEDKEDIFSSIYICINNYKGKGVFYSLNDYLDKGCVKSIVCENITFSWNSNLLLFGYDNQTGERILLSATAKTITVFGKDIEELFEIEKYSDPICLHDEFINRAQIENSTILFYLDDIYSEYLPSKRCYLSMDLNNANDVNFVIKKGRSYPQCIINEYTFTDFFKKYNKIEVVYIYYGNNEVDIEGVAYRNGKHYGDDVIIRIMTQVAKYFWIS